MFPHILSNGRSVVITSMHPGFMVYSFGYTLPTIYLNAPDTAASKNSEAKGIILAAAFSASGGHFAAANDQKQLFLFVTSDSPDNWQLVSKRESMKKGVQIVFTKDERDLIMADRLGDVTSFSVIHPQQPGFIILGHVSMLLDVLLVSGDKFIVTCDRDEKVRVSHYPNCHSIESYCLGHTKYVTCITAMNEFLVSGSGDGTVKLWETCSGNCLSTISLSGEPIAITSVVLLSDSTLVCGLLGQCYLVSLSVRQHGSTFLLERGSDITLSGTVISLCLIGNKLAVLQNYESEPVRIISHDVDTFQITPINEDLRTRWQYFNEVANCQVKFFDGLEKVDNDNVEEYMVNKRTRREGTANGDVQGSGKQARLIS